MIFFFPAGGAKCVCNKAGVRDGKVDCRGAKKCNCKTGAGYGGQKCDQCLNKFFKVGKKCQSK